MAHFARAARALLLFLFEIEEEEEKKDPPRFFYVLHARLGRGSVRPQCEVILKALHLRL